MVAGNGIIVETGGMGFCEYYIAYGPFASGEADGCKIQEMR